MHGDVTVAASVAHNNQKESSVIVEVVVKVTKKICFYLLVYFLGYWTFSPIWACALLGVTILAEKKRHQKTEKLKVQRAMAFGFEKTVILNTLSEMQKPSWVRFSDVEKVEWLNRFFKQLWDQVNEYAQDLVPKILEPAVQGYVSDFKFNEVILGNVPLRVDGIKVYDSQDRRKIEMDLDVSYDGDCYVTFQTFKFKGGIKDIQLHGRLRVVLTPLISKLPLIGGLQAYFMNPPHVDFDLIKSAQILDFPGVRSKIKNTTMNVINSMFLYPNAYSINLSQGVNVSKLAVFRTEGILRVHVVEAKNLIKMDTFGKSDPYVVLKVGSIRVVTPVIENTLDPKWDFWREFEIERNSELKIEVWDEDEGRKDDFLGKARVDIAQVTKVGQAEMPIPLQGVPKGTIYLRLTWLSLSADYSDLEAMTKETELLSPYLHTTILMIYLESSLNLPLVTKNPPSPFVILEIEEEVKQSDIEQTSCEPVWEKGFTFLVKDPRTAILSLKINDSDSDKNIGEVSFAVDSLKAEPRMELQRHTFFFNKPYSEASICCSMKLRILKNEYKPEPNDEDEEKPRKMLAKQESTASVRRELWSKRKNSSASESAKTSLNQSVPSDNESASSDNEPNSFLEEDDTVSALGQMKLSLNYSQQRQKLTVCIHEVKITRKNSHNIDSYVKLTLRTDKHRNVKKTQIIKNTSTPTFDATFDYLISTHDLNLSTLTLEVKSEGGFLDLRKRFLGLITISLAQSARFDKPYTEWYNLTTRKEPHVYHFSQIK